MRLALVSRSSVLAARDLIICLVYCVPLVAGCATSPFKSVGEARYFDGMGPHHRRITTSSPQAQEYFDQGMAWLFAFNHDEAIRSFLKAAEIDPSCAMPWWGVSIASGPQYNHPEMTETRTARAYQAMEEALQRIERTTPTERALIEALRERNADPEPEDRAQLNENFAKAMGEIWRAHPEDADVGALYAEATMVLQPWNLYTIDYEPHPITPGVVETLERVLELDPDHPGALHFYIHAVEPSSDPYRGVPIADRLSDLVPDSGHLLHMPSHIYVKTGRWEKAISQNVKAMESDARYRALGSTPLVQQGYMSHNSHMRVFAAMMCGREDDAMLAARDMWESFDTSILEDISEWVDPTMAAVYDVQKRFGRWDALLAEPAPPEFLTYTTASWRAARAVAYAAKKDFVNAEREHEAFRIAVEKQPDDEEKEGNSLRRALRVSDYFIAGEIALQRGDWAEAVELLEKAVAVEDTLSYGEPPRWGQPARHTLGVLFLKWGRPADAERVYRKDLAMWPKNGWSLKGLSQALAAQGKNDEAAAVLVEHEKVWRGAREPATTSCKCLALD